MSRNEVIGGLAFLALAALLAFAATRPGGFGHADCEFYVRLDGRAVDSTTGTPLANATVMAFPDRRWAVDPDMVESFREEMRKEISSHNGLPDPEGPHPVLISMGGGVRMTNESGAFSMYVLVHWFYEVGDRATQREKRPPKRHGIEAVRIEIEGRDPVILDVPTGTWTEHPDEDGLWATWDLGVVEVPGGTATGN